MFGNRKEGFKAKGVVTYRLFDAQGRLKDVRIADNAIVDDGFDYICNAMADNPQPAPMEFIAIGDSAVAVTAADSALGNELHRKIGAYVHTLGTKIYTLEATFTAGEGTGAVVESGQFNLATIGGIMLNRQTFAVINKGAADSLQVTWQITLT